MESFDRNDELLAGIHGHIERTGWSLMSVMGSRRTLPWTYTIGLLEKFDHPELIMIGVDDRSAGGVLNALGALAERSRRLPGWCALGQAHDACQPLLWRPTLPPGDRLVRDAEKETVISLYYRVGAQPAVDSVWERRSAIKHQTASTTPNGHAPERKP